MRSLQSILSKHTLTHCKNGTGILPTVESGLSTLPHSFTHATHLITSFAKSANDLSQGFRASGRDGDAGLAVNQGVR
jgi:hypothetical protein